MKALEWVMDHPWLRPIMPYVYRIMPRDVIIQFFKFGLVGVVGFLVDVGVLQFCMIEFGMNPYSGRLVSFVVAASATWICNRHFTFRGQGQDPAHVQWMKFLVVSAGGFVLNYGTYAILLAVSPLVYAHPTLGVAAGAIMGMFFNFFVSRRVVFK